MFTARKLGMLAVINQIMWGDRLGLRKQTH